MDVLRSVTRGFGCAALCALGIVLGVCRGGDGAQERGGGPRAAEPARVGLDAEGRMHVSEGDRCPVCAMEVVRHGRFASGLQLRDGRTFYFCGTGCMIRSWLHPEVFLGASKAEIGRVVVKEYFGGEQIDAYGAIFVAGSDVVGPMGPALVPLKTEADRETFVSRHGGTSVFRLSEMDDSRWEAITGKRAGGGARR